MGKKAANIKECLRLYQKEAIENIENYLESNSKKQAMIKMPTGTGKTGVIAVSAQISKGNILIIVPNAVLPEQTKKEIEEGFWKKIKCCIPINKKEINVVLGNELIDKIDFSKTQIIIITIQRLLNLKSEKNNIPYFEKLKQNINCIFFDEGHREMAEMWSTVVKEFKCKKVLFTATPYRNDKVVFDIDEKYTYRYSMKRALAEKSICGAKFSKMHLDLKNNSKIDGLIEFLLGLCKESNSRILLRMDKPNEIQQLVNEINKKMNNTAVGFHSTFDSEGNFCKEGKELFKIRDTYKIFIHSDMFIEGLDFCELNTLIILNSFDNAKSFIQQVGRVLRNSEGKSEATIYIWEDEFKKWQEQWQLYIKNDDQEKNIDYLDGFFKISFEFEKDFYNDINIPKKANIYISDISYFDKLLHAITNKIEGRIDLFLKQQHKEKNSNYSFWIMCYEKSVPSKYLGSRYYIDKSLELTAVLEVKKDNEYIIFYQDTSGFSLPITGLSINQVPFEEFYKMLPEEFDLRNARFTQTMQRKIGPQTLDITGLRLNSMPSNTIERMSFCRNVLGMIKSTKLTKRYVSPITARISDEEYCNYLEYINWCKEIITIWKRYKPNSYFNRYSKIVSPPRTTPTSIILEIDKQIKDINKGTVFFLESKFCKIIPPNKFQIPIKGKTCDVELYNLGTNNIKISIDLKKEFRVIDDVTGEEITLSNYLNSGRFRVHYIDKNIMYSNGIHFTPNITTAFTKAENWSVWNSIKTITGLASCKDEKLGDKSILTTWPPRSAFNVLINEINANYPNIDYIVCDDQNEEMADFVALSTIESKCYFIHCKQKCKSLSASDFQEVCGQAVKNIQYIITSDWSDLTHIQKHINRWKSTWKYTLSSKKKSIPPLIWNVNRLVKSPIKGGPLKTRIATIDDFVIEFKKILSNYDCKKEVWIIQGGLSQSDLRKQLETPKLKQKEQFVQLVWFLQSTFDTLIDAGADVKIMCQP